MSRAVTRRKKSQAWRSSRSIVLSPHVGARPGEPRLPKARSAWAAAAMHARQAVQARIVRAFGRYVAGEGAGPTDEELLTFARLAIAEQRLARRRR